MRSSIGGLYHELSALRMKSMSCLINGTPLESMVGPKLTAKLVIEPA